MPDTSVTTKALQFGTGALVTVGSVLAPQAHASISPHDAALNALSPHNATTLVMDEAPRVGERFQVADSFIGGLFGGGNNISAPTITPNIMNLGIATGLSAAGANMQNSKNAGQRAAGRVLSDQARHTQSQGNNLQTRRGYNAVNSERERQQTYNAAERVEVVGGAQNRVKEDRIIGESAARDQATINSEQTLGGTRYQVPYTQNNYTSIPADQRPYIPTQAELDAMDRANQLKAEAIALQERELELQNGTAAAPSSAYYMAPPVEQPSQTYVAPVERPRPVVHQAQGTNPFYKGPDR